MSEGRVLQMAERTVAEAERTAYLASLAARRRAHVAAGVQFWVFEHEAVRGRFVEFAEARDAAHLDRVAEPVATSAARWRSVEVG